MVLSASNVGNKSLATTTTLAPSTIASTTESQTNLKNQMVSDVEKCCGNGNNNSLQYQHSKINQCTNSNIESKSNNGTTRNSICNCQGM